MLAYCLMAFHVTIYEQPWHEKASLYRRFIKKYYEKILGWQKRELLKVCCLFFNISAFKHLKYMENFIAYLKKQVFFLKLEQKFSRNVNFPGKLTYVWKNADGSKNKGMVETFSVLSES